MAVAGGLDRARATVERLFDELKPRPVQAAYATGGSARALGKLVDPQLGSAELAVALHIVAKHPSRRLARAFGLSPSRASTLPAGTVLLACTQRTLGVPLAVARTGLREGVALSLLAESALAGYPSYSGRTPGRRREPQPRGQPLGE